MCSSDLELSDTARSMAVMPPTISTIERAVSESSNSGDMRATMKMPAVTMVAAWNSAEIGVGPSMESGSHTCSGTCADLPMAPMNRQMQITVSAGQPCPPQMWKLCPAIFANMKAFLVNRVGDFGFILGIGLIVAYSNTLNYGEAFAKGADIAKLTFPGTEWMLITVTCICLFIGAMGKSAQVPLHVWLPDSMEGPTPISALIHAATMVTAGIFMVARMSPLFEWSDTALDRKSVV